MLKGAESNDFRSGTFDLIVALGLVDHELAEVVQSLLRQNNSRHFLRIIRKQEKAKTATNMESICP